MTFLKTFARASCAVAAVLALSVPTMAGTLDDIIARGKIQVAIDMGSPPYASTDAQGAPQGSDVETAQKIAADLGVELEIVPTTGPGRIPVLLSGQADLVVATFRITAERPNRWLFRAPTA
ncbi:MAG: ABC-type amino acid transport periplasmic component protein [Devosia sp.]|nr:ABC-type amino acid transport periplasmic component protein [Devosia sp.]